MGEFDTSFSCSSLLCQETQVCFSETIERDYTNDYESVYLKNCKPENEDDYIEMLVQRETDVGFKANALFDSPTTRNRWLGCARSDAIEWIFNTRAIFGFQIHTAYLSVTYFDRFLSKRSIDDGKLWAIRLLSVACLSLAAKMEECRVPVLSEFPIEDYFFESQVIQRMELLVLSTLEWKMHFITPFTYLDYFITKFYGQSRPKGLVCKALELILAMAKEASLVNHRQSTIAAAALLAASDIGLTRKAMEVKLNFISLWGSLGNEHLFSCYNAMQEIEMRKSKTPKFVVSSHYSSIDSSSVHDLENFSGITTGGGSKRKLTFNESDQNSLAKKICRP